MSEVETTLSSPHSSNIPVVRSAYCQVTKFYADIPVGTIGKVVKTWTDKSGSGWTKLFFGKNMTGQKLQKSFPNDCVTVLENYPVNINNLKSGEVSGWMNFPRMGKCGRQYGCYLTVCDDCMNDEKMCGFCQSYISEGEERMYDGDYPCHKKCFDKMFGVSES